MVIQNVDKEELRRQYVGAEPFPFVKIDNLLDPAFAEEVASSYPTFEQATGQGREFKSVNERRKVQITESKLFPEPAKRLNEVLASPEFLSTLSYISGIPNLLADEELVGGGLHVTGPGGRLDVHVDFNYLEQRQLHRRLNLLLYLNPVWNEEWGGHIQLWDKKVTKCRHDFAPRQNRCVIFETSDISYHGVTPVASNAPFERRSFAAYYYTREAPAYWKGTAHSTIFQARPDERLRRYVLMPAEKLRWKIGEGVRLMKRGVKRIVRGSSR
ncbi:MAG: 2OG-Fe(II) oxygenase [Bacteroidota bacterium]